MLPDWLRYVDRVLSKYRAKHKDTDSKLSRTTSKNLNHTMQTRQCFFKTQRKLCHKSVCETV